jgi:tetratricopeptide (TPR) repeat protein
MRISTSVLVTALLFMPPALTAQEHQHEHGGTAPERLGTVSFPVSCNGGLQPQFTRAVALLHSFWYEQAEKAFRDVAAADPRCGMAWWGVAMSNYHQVWPSPYSPAELARGIAAAEKAKAIGAKTPREQGYIDAIAAFYKDADKVDIRTRAGAYEAAMERLTSRFPDDDEAAVFYGLALVAHGMSAATDKTYAFQKKAAGILNAFLAKHPDHPGIAHYLIHSFDYPALAPLALNAAYAYAKIAPSSPHALHMPSHIFVRLGMWQETIDSNIASADAAWAYSRHAHPGAAPFDALHAYDYLAYAWLQRGDDDKVKKLVEELSAIKALDVENFAGYYAMAAVPARFALERRRWSDAAALTVRPASFPWDRYGYAEALTHFARAVGSARAGDPTKARAGVERLVQLRQKLRDQKNDYWADQIDVQRRLAEGWIARAEGAGEKALALLREAADLEDSMDKSPVTPGSIVPAREMLGELLLEMNQPEKALEAYERSLKDSPNRLNGLSGAARAAELAGDRAKARAYYLQLAKLFDGKVGSTVSSGPESGRTSRPTS